MNAHIKFVHSSYTIHNKYESEFLPLFFLSHKIKTPKSITYPISSHSRCITLSKLEKRGHQLFNVTNSTNSQTKRLIKTQRKHTDHFKFNITNTTKSNIHLSKNLIQNYKIPPCSAQYEILDTLINTANLSFPAGFDL